MTNVYPITVSVLPHAFAGLARQDLKFHQALCELVDNALAAARPGEKAQVQILLAEHPSDPQRLRMVVADWGSGMDLDGLRNCLQLGSHPLSAHRMHEHGFGIINALSSLSGNSAPWMLATRADPACPYYVVRGPFDAHMTAEEAPDLGQILGDMVLALPAPATVIMVETSLAYARTATKGARTLNAAVLRRWLLEHLGVAYRGFLEPNVATREPSAKIMLTVAGSTVLVPPVPVPMCTKEKTVLEVLLGGQLVPVEYRYGFLDEDWRDHLLVTPDGTLPARYYYQNNIPMQGIDIRLGGRVIATAQLESIWKSENGSALHRHNSYNSFVGEVVIPELPRGILPTLNNKTSFDAQSPDWQALFDCLSAIPPCKSPTKLEEDALKKRWMRILSAAKPKDTVSDEYSVWPCGTRIDVVDVGDGLIDIFELKVGKARPLNLYQLRMYWDGLVLEGKQPTSATLIAQDFSSDIRAMAELMNKLPPPRLPDGRESQPYQFHLSTHAEKQLLSAV